MTARLFNFGIAKPQLKPEHEDWLRCNVLGLLQGGGSMWITGLASPSGTDAFNLALSHRRADSVIGFLRNQVPNSFEIAFGSSGDTIPNCLMVPDGDRQGQRRTADGGR